MSTDPSGTAASPRSLSRRRLLTGGAAAAGTATLAGMAAAAAFASRDDPPGPAPAAETGPAREPFHGRHQSGIATPPQAYAAFVAFDLLPGTDRDAVTRLLRLLTDDAARLTQGSSALGDTEPELAALPARLTVTFGFGPGLFTAAKLTDRRPASVAPLPAYPIDRLEQRWSGGDLLLQICADDQLTVAHAVRMLTKDARTFGTVRWVQRGFRRSRGTQHPAHTQHNVMGQLDGTANPVPGAKDFDAVVWVDDGPAWLRGGTTLVLRRIRAELETWDAVDRAAREFTVGRRLDTGAPLTGTDEHDLPDFEAVNDLGFPVIDEFAHVRRAHVVDPRLRIFRRPYNYDDALDPAGKPDTGLLFASYQADIARQYQPIQQRLAETDLLNQWTTPIGSAVFAIPPGCGPDGWIGEALLR